MKTFSLAKRVIFSFVLLSVFIFSCEKKNIYNNDFGVGIESFSLFDSENNEKKLGSDITCKIDTARYIILLTVPNTAILEGLKFNIKLSDKFSISPASGDPVDLELEETSEQFTETPFPKRYKKVFKLTSPDNTTQDYTVYIAKESAPKLTEFKIGADTAKGIKTEISAVITDDTDTVAGKLLLKIPYNVSIDLTGLSFTTIIPDDHVLNPAIGVISESIENKEFSLTTALGSKRVYTVEAVKGPYINAFKFAAISSDGSSTNTGITGEGVTGTIDHIAGAISITVPDGVTLSNLTPTIAVGENTKTDFTPSAQTDFSSNVEYTVTSSNPSATDFTKVYTVTVTQSAEPAISEFKFLNSNNSGKNLGNDISGTIDHNSGTITVKVPHNANISALTPTITAASTLANTQVYSGDTGQGAIAATSFEDSHTTPVKYSAVGPAGGRKVYSVKVYKEPSIISFKFTSSANGSASFPVSPAEYSGNITQGDFSANGTITITVANTVNVTELKKATITGDNINTTNPVSISFTGSNSPYSATITVANEHLSSFIKTYNVTVTKEAAPKLTEFKISADTNKGIQSEVTGDITDDDSNSAAATGTIKLKFDHKVAAHHTDIDLTGLTYTNGSISGCTLTPGTPLTGQSIHDQTFTLTKTDTGSKRVYTVQTVKGPFIKSFKFANSGNTGITTEVTGNIDHAAGTISLTVPATVKKTSSNGTNTVTLTPTIELGGDDTPTVNPTSATEKTFTLDSETPYKVTGADEMEKTYQVTVTRTPSAEAQITEFTIDSSNTGNISETGANDKGRIVVPVSTEGSKTPTIKQSDYATVRPNGAETFSYENPVTYTVTSEDNNTSKSYDVYVYDSSKTVTTSNITINTPPAGANVTSVDESTRVITVTVPQSTDLSSLTLTLTDSGTPSYTLTAEPASGQDFSDGKEVKYTLTDTSSKVVGHYWVKVVKSS
ncbi:RHS repeat domain-containing protein [Ichthyobacterium seriolicida]|uniref:Pkd domain containing protein n=1 Tax=Ichthyobacterium seriolicida TaxID=242600 RepID=A0A1J1E3T1_9FLAO|nr:hypothetical protein [Ichthyobacterium seriolicida]BAV94716.1 pkd domain containing protein [Ichthyobacterium seriolicida]